MNIFYKHILFCSVFDEFERARASARRVFGLIDTPNVIQNPTQPKLATSPIQIVEESSANTISWLGNKGNILYVTDRFNFYAIDLTDKFNPIILGKTSLDFAIDDNPSQIAIKDSNLFVLYVSELRIFNLNF